MKPKARYRKYVCYDCGKGQLLPLRAFDRKTRPRCSACGSIRLDPGDSAAETLAEGRAGFSNAAALQDKRSKPGPQVYTDE